MPISVFVSRSPSGAMFRGSLPQLRPQHSSDARGARPQPRDRRTDFSCDPSQWLDSHPTLWDLGCALTAEIFRVPYFLILRASAQF